MEQRQRGGLTSFISQMPYQFILFEPRQRGSLTSVFPNVTPIGYAKLKLISTQMAICPFLLEEFLGLYIQPFMYYMYDIVIVIFLYLSRMLCSTSWQHSTPLPCQDNEHFHRDLHKPLRVLYSVSISCYEIFVQHS